MSRKRYLILDESGAVVGRISAVHGRCAEGNGAYQVEVADFPPQIDAAGKRVMHRLDPARLTSGMNRLRRHELAGCIETVKAPSVAAKLHDAHTMKPVMKQKGPRKS